jgi:hypothetical protein
VFQNNVLRNNNDEVIKQFKVSHMPDVMVDWLTLLLRIREVPGSNVGLETGCPARGFSWFFSVSPNKCRDITLNYATTASFHILSNYLFTYHPFIHATWSELMIKNC